MPQTFNLPLVLDMPELPAYLLQVENRMNNALTGNSSVLDAAVLRLVNAPGKRLRPALVIAAAGLSGKKPDERVFLAAAAIELIHIGSLVHDDIIDEAHTRRDVATINAREGLNAAIVGGDMLFATACALAGNVSQKAGLLAAQTIVDLCKGQSAELSRLGDLQRTEQELLAAMAGKTAALMAAACKMGGLAAHQPPHKLQALSKFGTDFGMSFQLIDDVLDFVSSEKLVGKPVGNDILEGVYTLPVILAVKKLGVTKVKQALKHKSQADLTNLLLENGCITEAVQYAQKYNKSAEASLGKVFNAGAEDMAQLPIRYLDWILTNLVAVDHQRQILI